VAVGGASETEWLKKRHVYQPRVFDGRIITTDEIERIHKEGLEFERIEVISDAGIDRRALARAGAQAAAEETAGLNSQMLEIVISLIIGFALGYGVREWAFRRYRQAEQRRRRPF
jgi:hypothetical protein